MNKEIKTMTLTAQVSISRTESGLGLVQVMPDDPRAGVVTPFRGAGYGQMLSSGCFDFVRRKRTRRKPVLKLPHSSLSYSPDGYDRFTFVLPSEQRGELCQLLRKEAMKASAFVAKDNGTVA